MSIGLMRVKRAPLGGRTRVHDKDFKEVWIAWRVVRRLLEIGTIRRQHGCIYRAPSLDWSELLSFRG